MSYTWKPADAWPRSIKLECETSTAPTGSGRSGKRGLLRIVTAEMTNDAAVDAAATAPGTARTLSRVSRLLKNNSGRVCANVYGLVPSVPSVPSEKQLSQDKIESARVRLTRF